MFKMLRAFLFDFGAEAELVVLAHCMHTPPRGPLPQMAHPPASQTFVLVHWYAAAN